MSVLCPISSRLVDERAVRATGLLVALAAVAACFALTGYLLALLAADYLVRGFLRPELSPLAAMGRWAVAGARFAKRPINAGPKIFAARLGFVLCAVAALLYWLSPGSAVRVPLGILAGCAALEGLLGLCLGCHLYTWLLRLAPGPARPDPTSTTPMRGLG